MGHVVLGKIAIGMFLVGNDLVSAVWVLVEIAKRCSKHGNLILQIPIRNNGTFYGLLGQCLIDRRCKSRWEQVGVCYFEPCFWLLVE